MSRIKLVALDLDGTVVDESQHISPQVQSLLSRLPESHGVKVIVATGRMFPSSIPFARRLGVRDPLISYQGAMVRDITEDLERIQDHPILFHQGIEMAVARELIDMIHEQKLHANLYVNDCLFTTHLNENSAYYQNISGVVPQHSPNLHDNLTDLPSKIMILDDQLDAIIEAVDARFAQHVSISRSRRHFCEIVHASVSKWTALSTLIEGWGIQPSEVMAIGDQENDLSMIIGAGVGVAMGNAPDHVKAQADFVTKSIEEDGVVHAIEQYVLQGV